MAGKKHKERGRKVDDDEYSPRRELIVFKPMSEELLTSVMEASRAFSMAREHAKRTGLELGEYPKERESSSNEDMARCEIYDGIINIGDAVDIGGYCISYMGRDRDSKKALLKIKEDKRNPRVANEFCSPGEERVVDFLKTHRRIRIICSVCTESSIALRIVVEDMDWS